MYWTVEHLLYTMERCIEPIDSEEAKGPAVTMVYIRRKNKMKRMHDMHDATAIWGHLTPFLVHPS
jgi:hypothetical protein